jgi:replicative DNA helicase
MLVRFMGIIIMSEIVLSKDQEVAYKTIAKWLADGGIVHPKQKDPQLLTLGGFAGTGKALALNTLIPTPNGWKTMGELDIGDKVFSDNGNICSIIATSQIMTDHDCFEFEFSDGTKVVADAEHIWKTKNCNERWNNKPSKERLSKDIFETQISSKHANHSIDMPPSINTPEQNLVIDPYLLGVWLGDGAKATARVSSTDEEIIQSFSSKYNINKIAGENCDWGISAKESSPSLLVQLRDMNLLFKVLI